MRASSTLGLVALALYACGGPPPQEGSHAAADTVIAPPLLSFAADWSVSQSAPLWAGGKARIHYVLDRLPRCRQTYNGLPAWAIVAYYNIDGGTRQQAALAPASASSPGTGPVEVDIATPPGSDLALWFYNSDDAGCIGWDSDYGRDFHFGLTQGPPFIHFSADWSVRIDGALRRGADLVIDYDVQRLPRCRQDYNGYATWDIQAHYRFDGGPVLSSSVTQVAGASRVPALLRISPPSGATTLEMWFENTDRTGCDAYDSRFGSNFSFTLQ